MVAVKTDCGEVRVYGRFKARLGGSQVGGAFVAPWASAEVEAARLEYAASAKKLALGRDGPPATQVGTNIRTTLLQRQSGEDSADGFRVVPFHGC